MMFGLIAAMVMPMMQQVMQSAAAGGSGGSDNEESARQAANQGQNESSLNSVFAKGTSQDEMQESLFQDNSNLNNLILGSNSDSLAIA